MHVCIVDVYADRPYRVSKDTNGGFGTGNEFGNGLISSLLTRLKKRAVDFPVLSIAYIAAALDKHGHAVSYLRNRMPSDEMQVDLVLIPSSIVEHESEIAWGNRLKEAGFKVGFTGPFAATQKEAYLQAGDFVVEGEPEFLFLQDPPPNQLQGVVPVAANVDLDTLPFPKWDLFGADQFKHVLAGGSGGFFPLLASRGCPHSCSFYCTYPLQQGKAVRQRSPENVVDEMQWLKEKHGANFIMFRDPIFGINPKWLNAFAEELIRRGLNIDFAIETHLNCLNEDNIDLLSRACLNTVKTGVENSDEFIMKNFSRKSVKIDRNKKIIRYIESKGIKVFAFYIFAMPEDDYHSCMKTIAYAKKLNTYGAPFSVATPYPGTSWYDQVKDTVTASSFDEVTQYRLVWNHPKLSKADIERIMSKAYANYYLRPRWIAKIARFKLKKKFRSLPLSRNDQDRINIVSLDDGSRRPFPGYGHGG